MEFGPEEQEKENLKFKKTGRERQELRNGQRGKQDMVAGE